MVKSGRGSKGHERSEKNMPVACFGARVRVAARQGRQRASSPAPKRNTIRQDGVFFGQVGQRLERARAQREKHAGGMFWCPCACGGPAGPPASLVARSKKTPPIRVVFFSAYHKKSRRVCRPQAAKNRNHFSPRHVRGENTSQTASVEFLRSA